mmetsp:Transcript_30476/g.81987  ORF Transcript_30476/g.81987 Transcript_30476/m.81987 type:complete len:351 (-) Transcript_30476:793-1845(-)
MPCSMQGSFVAHVGNVGAREARRERGHLSRGLIAVLGELDLAEVLEEDVTAPHDVRQVDEDLAVKAARPHEGVVQDVRPVGRCEDDDARRGVEAVHLHEELVERVLTLVVASREAALAALAPHRIDLVDEDYARGHGARLGKEVADARGTDAHEHLDEVRARDGQERDGGLAGGGLGEHGFARARRTHEERALGHLGPELGKLVGVLEEVDKLGDLRLGLVTASHVLEGHLGALVRLDHLGLGLAHLEDVACRPADAAPAAAAAGAAHEAAREEEPHSNDGERGCHLEELARPARLGLVKHGQIVGGVHAELLLRLLELLLKRLHGPDGEVEARVALLHSARLGRRSSPS